MYNKKASVLIYSVILTALWLSLGIIVMNNTSTLLIAKENNNIINILNQNISQKNKIIWEKISETNSDWNWFTDNIWCPQNFTMSWTTIKNNSINTSLKYIDWLETKFYCSSYFNWYEIKLYFNSFHSDLEKAEYKTQELLINSWSLNWNFTDLENTYFDLENKNNYYYSDNIDDNFDSDNYISNSTWGIEYPNNYEDNDDYIRKNIIWTIYPGKTQNIFWNNLKIEKFIENNSNNTWSLNSNLWEVVDWNLFIEVDNSINLKLIKIDKNKYDDFNEIKRVETLTWTISWSWYIENISWNLSLNSTTSANTYNFDFKNNWYLLFLENSSDSNYINYYLSWETNSWTWIILNPIDDSINNSYEYLWYDIFIWEDWDYYTKIKNMVWKK